MDITEIDNSTPVRMKPYKTSPTDRRTISKILEDWKRAGIVADSTFTYASPVLLVNKTDSPSHRLTEEALRRLSQAESTNGYTAVPHA